MIGLVGGFGTEIKLCVISIGMEAETMAVDDLTMGEHVAGGEKGTFGHIVVNWSRSDKRCLVVEVGLKPGENSTSEAERAVKTLPKAAERSGRMAILV